MIWELATPVFVGVLLALLAVIFLMGKAHKLTRGPKMLVRRLRAGLRGCPCGHPGGACRCGSCGHAGHAGKPVAKCGGH